MANIISGSLGAAGAGATVTLSGQSSASTTGAAITGNYSFSGLAPGTYFITPSVAGKAFSPTSQTEVIVSTDITGVNFFTFTPVKSGSIIGVGPQFATRVESPKTSIEGTNLDTDGRIEK